ncbi:ARM repeat superfamily protein [Wolffia australiana]
MANSIEAQLQAIRASLKGREDLARKPLTRPSVLFDAREASDIDLRSILPIALSGLDVLVGHDARFESYRNTLFSHTSLDLDREKMQPQDEQNVNKSVSLYLRLLSGYLHHPAALKTLEYLIRRYRVHVFNSEELILCALPHHDTHAFVRVVQLLELGNNKWVFLEAVKTSGAPPPRKVIVQQCLCDRGVLEAICNYALPAKGFCHAKVVVCFATAVVVEALGASKQLESDIVQRVMPFIFAGLNPDLGGGDENKAGALMVAASVASRGSLSVKLSNSLICAIGRMAHHDAKEHSVVPWLRMSLMTIANIVQTQSLQGFPRKILKCMVEIEDLPAVISTLSQEFDITKFLLFLLEALVDSSPSDASCCRALTSIIETVPMKSFIDTFAIKVLGFCVRWAQGVSISDLPNSGSWAKEVFVAIDKAYPSEWRAAVQKFLEESKVLKDGGDTTETLSLITDGNADMTFELADSKIWFALDHPKPLIRRTALSGLSASQILELKQTDARRLNNIQDAILRRLQDDDLSVIQAVFSIEGLTRIISCPLLLNAVKELLVRCLGLFETGCVDTIYKASEVALSCMDFMHLNIRFLEISGGREIASLIFPFLLILPKTWKANLKALELAKDLNWKFYSDSFISFSLPIVGEVKAIEPADIISTNWTMVGALAATLLRNPESHIKWLKDCCYSFPQSKKLFLSLLLRATLICNEDTPSLRRLHTVSHPALKLEWSNLIAQNRALASKELSAQKLDTLCNQFTVETVSVAEVANEDILLCVYWSLLKSFSVSSGRNHAATTDEWRHTLRDLFVFLSTSLAFKEHLLFLVMKCCASPAEFISEFFTSEGYPVNVRLRSLVIFRSLCSSSSMHNTSDDSRAQLVSCLPSLLIPLSAPDKDVRTAAVECIEELHKLHQLFDATTGMNGYDQVPASCLFEFLALLISQKILILSDANYLSSFLTSILVPSQRLLVSEDVDKRLDQESKENILAFLLKSSLRLCSFGRFRILALFKRLGSSMMKIKEIQSVLDDLLSKRKLHCIGMEPQSRAEVSDTDIQTLCHLLEISLMSNGLDGPNSDITRGVLEALTVDGKLHEDPVVVQPCITVLRSLTSTVYDNLGPEMQEELCGHLIILYRSSNDDVRNAAKEALSKLNITGSVMGNFLQIGLEGDRTGSAKKRRRKQSWLQTFFLGNGCISRGKNLSILGSTLDILLLKKKMKKRETLVYPLFKLLRQLMEDDVDQGNLGDVEVSYIKQSILLVLRDITDSVLKGHPQKDDFVGKFDIKLLVQCAQSTNDVATVNLLFSLLSSAAKISSQWVSENIFELFSLIGHAASRQIDSHSQHVTEELISALIPCWESTSNDIKGLLKVFINVLPEIFEERRLTLMVHLLRVLGEKQNIGVFVALLLKSLATKKDRSSEPGESVHGEWEFSFAVKFFEQYSCQIWLPSLVILLQETMVIGEREHFSFLSLSLHFILQKLKDTSFVFAVESEGDSECVQNALRELMEKAFMLLKHTESRNTMPVSEKSAKKQLKECILSVVKCISEVMAPSQFFEAIGRLVDDDDQNVKKKALRLLSQTIANRAPKESKKRFAKPSIFLDERSTESFCELCSKIVQLLDKPGADDLVKVTAVSSLEVLAKAFPTSDYISTSCLAVVAKHITSENPAFSSSCLRSTGALISVLGSKMLPVLPHCMKNVLERAISSDRRSVILSVLGFLEIVLENLGGFLNPYLESILDLLVLHPDYVSESDDKVKTRADLLRKLVSVKIPARLLLAPLMKIFKRTFSGGEKSISLAYEMLANMVASMDRSSVASYHEKVFQQCIVGLDLRRQRLEAVKNVDGVEDSAIEAVTALTLKLTESMFRPLFIHLVDWAESDIQERDSAASGILLRKIPFYKLISKLVQQHRSLFVPYFKYLLEGCVRCLTEGEAVQAVSSRKKHKKAKLKEVNNGTKMFISPELWHLRSLILFSLYKCFLFDTGNLKFLESSNFQSLLKPIASQLLVDPPTVSSEHYQNLPTVEEVDESLVCCLGQMAVTVGSDDVWKPLNHEVLMHTRSEKTRARILGLRVIKYMVEHFKEEYLVSLPETIPFLSELLEDVELPVKSLAQEILRELESLSGESLQQYL